jgi:exodeoxyribonuclease-3
VIIYHSLCCLQETKLIDENFPVIRFQEIGYHCEFSGEKSYNRVAIISKQKPTLIKKGFDNVGEFTSKRSIEGEYNNMSVINVYIPNGQELLVGFLSK